MVRVALAAGSALVLGAAAAVWIGPDARLAAAGLAEVAVLAAVLNVGRRPHDDDGGGAAAAA